MPSPYTQIGTWTFQTFTLVLALGVLVSAWLGWRRALPLSVYGEGGGWGKHQLANTYLGALIGGAIGARLFHVVFNWDTFSDNLFEAPNLAAGGLDWHGAVVGGVIGLGLMVYGQDRWERHTTSPPNPLSNALARGSRAQRGGGEVLNDSHEFTSATVPSLPMGLWFNLLLDSLAPALPIIGLTTWYGCLAAGCGYGREVDTLANTSPLVASELVDVFGIVAPRFNIPYFGMAWCVVTLGGLVLLSRGWRTRYIVSLQNRRFWLTLALLSGGMFVIGFFRADRTPMVIGLRADQLLDGIMFVAGIWQTFRGKSG